MTYKFLDLAMLYNFYILYKKYLRPRLYEEFKISLLKIDLIL